MQFDLVLNQPDAGSFSLPLVDVAAQAIAIGKLVETNYRGGPIGSGGWFIENIGNDLVAAGDKSGQIKKISGRGGLVLLEDAIVWSDTESSRTWTAVTMGSILVTLLSEAKARGCFPELRVEFSATQDSNGSLWTDSTTITLQTGTSLLDVARQFSELGLDFRLLFDWPRNDYALYVYQTSIGRDVSASVVLRPGLNCEELGDDQESSALKNAYLVPYQAGITSTSDAASIAAYRRRETMFQASNAPSSGSALVLANAELNAVKDPKRSIRIKVNDAGGPMAGVDYDIGDWVGVDWQDGNAPAKYRVRGMSYAWDAGQKYADITLTLNSLKIEQEIRSAIALKKIANGSLGSSVSGAAPDAGTAVDAHDADGNAHVNRPLSGDLGGTLGSPIVAKLRGVSLKNPLNISDGQVLKYSAANSQIEPGSVQWNEVQGTPGTFTPGAHATTHQAGGGDAVKLDDLEAPDDNTDLDASITKHGLMKKFPGGTSDFLRADGAFATPAPSHADQIMFSVEGTLAIADNPLRIYNATGISRTISKVFIAVDTAPTGASVIVDIHKDGTTIFTNQAHRPAIAAAGFTGVTTTIDVATWADGSYLTMHIDQIGSTIAGANIVVTVVYS